MPRFPGDLAIARWVQAYASPWLDGLMEGVAFLGERYVALGSILALVAALFLARRWALATVLLGVPVMEVFVQIGKAVVARPRPSEELVRVLEANSSGSFPSGHVYHAAVVGGLLLALVVPHIPIVWLRRGVAALLITWILATAVSRIYVGAHWPSDILASVALGIPSVALLVYVHKRLAARALPRNRG